MKRHDRIIVLSLLLIITAGTLALCYGAYQNSQNRILNEEHKQSMQQAVPTMQNKVRKE